MNFLCQRRTLQDLNLLDTDFGVLRRLWLYSAYNNKAKCKHEAKNKSQRY